MLKLKSLIAFSIPLLVSVGVYSLLTPELSDREKSRQEYDEWIENHEFMNREHLTKEQIKKMPKRDRPDLAYELDFINTADPVLKRPTKEVLVDYLLEQQNRQKFQPRLSNPGSVENPWEERGPLKVGGRTRALMIDPNDPNHNKVWAGGVSGGLWYNDSIYNPNSSWVNVSQFWENIPISSITYDPLDLNTFYVGTGEGFGSSSSLGAGIWKTTDGGLTWNILPATSDYKYVLDIVVTVENDSSQLYVASESEYYAGQVFGSSGVYKSSDGGASFSITQDSTGANLQNIGDFEWSSVDSSLWASSSDGGRIYKLNDSTQTWELKKHFGNNVNRVEIALSNQNADVIYAVYERYGQVDGIVKSTDNGVTWVNKSEPNDPDGGIPAADFSRGQAWYDLTIEVSPSNDNFVLVGGINIHKTVDGGSNWTTISEWYGSGGNYLHADQHNIIFKPNSLDTCLFTNDGGVFYTRSLSFSNPNFYNANKNYNVTQFYATDLNGSEEEYLAGAQDNGTQKFQGAGLVNTTEVTGGDGAYCFIDKQGSSRYITSYVYNRYYESTSGNFFSTFMNENEGRFINPAGYDDNLDVFFSAFKSNRIYRYIFDSFDENPGLTEMHIPGIGSSATAFTVSPYTTDSTVLFIGTASGRVFRVDGANKTNFEKTALDPSNFPNGTVSSISLGASEDEILVTFSNYGVKSVWYTTDGGDTWKDIESNLPNFPVRSSLINPFQPNRAILATELGIWRSDDLAADSVVWVQSNNGIQNVRVDMLRTRRSDGKIAAATFGRGLFTSTFDGTQNPEAVIETSSNSACLSEVVTLSNSSLHYIDSVKWILPATNVNLSSGSDTSFTSIDVTFTTPGTYEFKLIAYNANGVDTISQNITVATFAQPTVLRGNYDLLCSETGDSYKWFFNGTVINGAVNQTHVPAANGTYRVEVIHDDFCSLKSAGFLLENVNVDNLNEVTTFDYISTSNELIIQGKEDKTYRVSILNTIGKQIQEFNFNGEINKSLLNLNNGVYYISIYDGSNQIDVKKIVR